MLYKIRYIDELSHAKKGDTIPGSKYISRKWDGKRWRYIYTTVKRETKALSDKLKSKMESNYSSGGKKYYKNGYYDYNGACQELFTMMKGSSFGRKYPDIVNDEIETLKKRFDDQNKKYGPAMAVGNLANGLAFGTNTTVYGQEVAKRAKEIWDEAGDVALSNTKNEIHGEDEIASWFWDGQPKK